MFVTPVWLLDAVARVRREHPYPAQGEIVAGERADSDTAALWEWLLSVPEAELDHAIVGLSPHDERVLLYGAHGRLSDSAVLRVLGRIFMLRTPSGSGRLAWDAFLLSGDAAFRRAASGHAAEFPARTLWKRLLESANPLYDAIRSLEVLGVRLEEWAGRPEVMLQDRPLVVRALQRASLELPFVLATCAREHLDIVARWSRAVLLDDERVRWYSEYMAASYREGWPARHPVLDDIIERFGEPDEKRPFWRDGQPENVVRAVVLWLRDRQLTDLLGEGERVQFWRRFLPHIRRLEESRSGEAVFISCERWFAVQYKELRRATYMFRPDQYRELRWKREPGLYTRYILPLASEGRHVGRYEHRGNAWEVQAQEEVLRLLNDRSEVH
jgi:hypothetical protein